MMMLKSHSAMLEQSNEKVVEMLRPIVRKCFRKSFLPYRSRTAWGLTQIFRRHFTNSGIKDNINVGDLAKAMFLEGFRGYYDKWGLLHFNVKKTDCDVLELVVTSVVYGCEPDKLKKRLKQLFSRRVRITLADFRRKRCDACEGLEYADY